MATVRRVPSPYADIPAALTAASIGDTILLAPGSYSRFTLNKACHIVAETGGTVTIVGADRYTNIVINLASVPANTTVLIEGLSFSGGWIGGQVGNFDRYYNYPVSANLTLTVNRCTFGLGSGANFNWIWLTAYDHARNKLRVINCKLTVDWPACPLGGVEVLKCADFGFTCANPNDKAPNGTVGYGPAYGSWLAPQFMGQSYRVAGKLRLGEGVVPGLARVHLFRSDAANRIERMSWAVATPGAPDAQGFADWAFDYLPTDHTYYVGIVTPSGHESKLLGPYIPAQG